MKWWWFSEFGHRHRQHLLSSLVIVAVLITGKCDAYCSFAQALQGSYITQGLDIPINISDYSISMWGICHGRIGNNIILEMSTPNSEETKCFRCFNFELVSRNVLRVTTESNYMQSWYTNPNKAVASCPSQNGSFNSSNYSEIILYKYLELDGTKIRHEHCPINGRYKFLYNNDDGEEESVECATYESELDNCPSGSAINLRFKGCSFENHEINFECIGHWEGADKQKYVALISSKPGEADDQLGSQYRCAIYEKDEHNGMIKITFSKDSNCSAVSVAKNVHHLSDKRDQHHIETFTLKPIEEPKWPAHNFCEFPDWMLGEWEQITATKNLLVFRDHVSFKTYTMKCIENISGHILVFSRTQCNEEVYQCIKVENRGPNIIEFQIGSETSHNFTHEICSYEYFDDTRWLTQSRIDRDYVYSPCPVSGTFIGTIPDSPTHCAKLFSDCTSKDLMSFEVALCESELPFDERKYQCLGQWEENDFVYIYTKRLDIGAYECFLGGMKSEMQLLMKEAGDNCQRTNDLFINGMKLYKTGSCQNVGDQSHSSQHYHTVINSTEFSTTTTSTTIIGTANKAFHTTESPSDNTNNILSTSSSVTTNPPKLTSKGHSNQQITKSQKASILFSLAIILLSIFI